MNRILFEPGEARDGVVALAGPRARHIASVLRAREGDRLRLGEIGGPRYDEARVESVGSAECRVLLGPPAPPPPRAPVDLLLAVPRPKCLRRLWPQLAALGPRRIFLTAAEKVEKDYWGSTFLRPEAYRPLLVEGLAQAGDTLLPEVGTRRRLRPFVEDELPLLYPEGARLLAHPAPGAPDAAAALAAAPGPGPVLVAVGPEGGWSPFELGLFASVGFRAVSLGPRILRTDTAVVALLALASALRPSGPAREKNPRDIADRVC